MTTGAQIIEPGIADAPWLDGAPLAAMPVEYQPQAVLAQTVFDTLAGTKIISAAYRGDGLPDRIDTFAFGLPYEIDDNFAALADQLELARVTPGPHYFTDIKQRYAYYTLPPNRSYLYLPREDAFGKWGLGSAADVRINGGGAMAVTYQAGTVLASDAVPAGNVYISKTLIKHPDSGRWVAPFKIGSPSGAQAVLVVKYYQVYRVDIVDLVTSFGDRVAGREDKTLYLAEV